MNDGVTAQSPGGCLDKAGGRSYPRRWSVRYHPVRFFHGLPWLLLVVCVFGAAGCITRKEFRELEEKIDQALKHDTKQDEAIRQNDKRRKTLIKNANAAFAEYNVTILQLRSRVEDLEARWELLLEQLEARDFVTKGDEIYKLQQKDAPPKPARLPPPGELLKAGSRYVQEEKYLEAILVYQEFLSRFPKREESYRAHAGIGRAYLALEAYQDAADAQRKAWALLQQRFEYEESWPSDTGQILYQYGQTLEKLGNVGDAVGVYRRIREEFSDLAVAQQAGERLQILGGIEP